MPLLILPGQAGVGQKEQELLQYFGCTWTVPNTP